MKARGAPIAVPVVILVVATLMVATILLFAVTFSGPPPRPANVNIDTLARELRTGRNVPGEDNAERIVFGTEPPRPNGRARPAPRLAADLAKRIGTTPDLVRAYVDGPPGPSDRLHGFFLVGWKTSGGWRIASTEPQPFFSHWHKETLSIMAVALIVLGFAAWWIARVISKPLVRLADAASVVRIGTRSLFPSDGPREVRALAAALDHMQTRLIDASAARTTMLAAIAHDLGTPLARLAFWIEQLPEEARDRASAEIDQMRDMIGAVLRFTREERVPEQRQRIDLGSLLESLVDDMTSVGADVTLTSGPRAIVRGDSAALRRLFANILENAVRYGERARLVWEVVDGRATIYVGDDGPGFPTQHDRLFEPFERGEPSRNRTTGGHGLGLTIARSIADAHGGSITLGAGANGANVTVRLPIEVGHPPQHGET